jgi:hypothetical protein
MDPHSKKLLLRWQALQKSDGLQRASSLARALWFSGFVLCLVVVFGIVYLWSPVAIAVAAAAMGWVIAESNALRSRLAQWPFFSRYIDWRRVEEDLSSRDAHV